MAGWSYPDWEGIVYPPNPGRHFDPLSYLAGLFNTLELNNTFYRPPAPAMSASWARRVSDHPDFRFTAKAWRQFTHESQFSREEARVYRRGLGPLLEARCLGCVLLQYPWSFRNTATNRLRLLRALDALEGIPLAVEVRHDSWNEEEFWELLRTHGAAYCGIDQPPHRGGLPPLARTTAPLAYFRLHGRNRAAWFAANAGRDQRYDYLYSSDELQELAQLLCRMAAATDELFVIANNHFRGQAAANALQLKALLVRLASPAAAPPAPGDASGHRPATQRLATMVLPPGLLAAYPELGSIGRPDPRAGPLQLCLPTDE